MNYTEAAAPCSIEKKKVSKLRVEFSKLIKKRNLFIMMLPGIIYFIIFKYIPIYGLQLAFKDYIFKAGITGSKWVGLEHFQNIFAMQSFWQVFKNTLIISAYQLVFGFPAPILFAILLNEVKNIHFKKTIQTVSYLPHFVSWVVLGGLFTQFLSPSSGPVNIMLMKLGIEPIHFLGDVKWFRGVLVATGIWKDLGWSSIVYLAALSGVEQEMYEAARIDGATRFQQILYITLPSLAPVITIMLIFDLGKIINDNFDQVFNMYSMVVYSVGDVISTYVYRTGITQMQYSTGTAIGLFKNVISFSMVIMANYIANKINGNGIW